MHLKRQLSFTWHEWQQTSCDERSQQQLVVTTAWLFFCRRHLRKPTRSRHLRRQLIYPPVFLIPLHWSPHVNRCTGREEEPRSPLLSSPRWFWAGWRRIRQTCRSSCLQRANKTHRAESQWKDSDMGEWRQQNQIFQSLCIHPPKKHVPNLVSLHCLIEHGTRSNTLNYYDFDLCFSKSCILLHWRKRWRAHIMSWGAQMINLHSNRTPKFKQFRILEIFRVEKVTFFTKSETTGFYL